jgi:hypothetical protein
MVEAFCDDLAGQEVQQCPEKRMVALIKLQSRFGLSGLQGHSMAKYLDELAKQSAGDEVVDVESSDDEEDVKEGAHLLSVILSLDIPASY